MVHLHCESIVRENLSDAMNNRTKAVSISQEVKKIVHERDRGCCILCGRPLSVSYSNAHFIPRSKGGLGIPENIVTLCSVCHNMYDFSPKRLPISHIIANYLIKKYPNWDARNLVYKKGTK